MLKDSIFSNPRPASFAQKSNFKTFIGFQLSSPSRLPISTSGAVGFTMFLCWLIDFDFLPLGRFSLDLARIGVQFPKDPW